MKKYEIRREFIKLRTKQNSYSKCQRILERKFNVKVSIRTLKRWQQRFNEGIWDYCDKSTRPNKIYYKVTLQAEKEIIKLRNKTGWSAKKLQPHLKNLGICKNTINSVLVKNGLTRKDHNRGQRQKYVRFQRNTPNSLWHIDDSEFGDKGKIIAVVDDNSRYCLGILHIPSVTTIVVTEFLDQLISQFGTPKQIISDNGSPYGLKSKYSKFDIWCRRRGIEHIRTKVKIPQTNGKVERLFSTIKTEISYCNNDLEYFRYRYNVWRTHESLFNQQTPGEKFNRKLN